MTHLNRYHPNDSRIKAMLYLNWSIAYRENMNNVISLYFLWASRVYDDATAGVDLPVREAYRVQKKYNWAFIAMKICILILYGPVGSCLQWLGTPIVAVWLICVTYYIVAKFFIARFLTMYLGAKIEGIDMALRWPSRSSSECLLRISNLIRLQM